MAPLAPLPHSGDVLRAGMPGGLTPASRSTQNARRLLVAPGPGRRCERLGQYAALLIRRVNCGSIFPGQPQDSRFTGRERLIQRLYLDGA
jgi:hypothetical protein